MKKLIGAMGIFLTFIFIKIAILPNALSWTNAIILGLFHIPYSIYVIGKLDNFGIFHALLTHDEKIQKDL